MSFNKATFPGGIWDGFSRTRTNLEDDKSPSYDDWDEAIAEIIAIEQNILDVNDRFQADTADFPVGLLVDLQSDGSLIPASSNSGEISGMVVAAGEYVTRGKVSSNDWTNVIGAMELEVGATYYLRTFGQIRTTPPSTGYVVSIGEAQSATLFDFNIGISVQL